MQGWVRARLRKLGAAGRLGRRVEVTPITAAAARPPADTDAAPAPQPPADPADQTRDPPET